MAKSRKGIQFDNINIQQTSTARAETVQREIARVKVPCLSDAIVNRTVGGQHVLIALDNARKTGVFDPSTQSYSNEQTRWKIRKILNRDGSTPKKGDTVKVLFQREQRDAANHKLSAEQWADIVRRGGQGQERYHMYTLDDDCCFECGYQDAMFLLTEYGVHYETRMSLGNRKETQGMPGRIVHNWLYEEVVDGINDTQDKQKKLKVEP